MTDVEILEEAYKNWIPFESDPLPEINKARENVKEHPSRESDGFYKKVVTKFNEDQDTFWLDSAIEYSRAAKDKTAAQEYLTHILENAEKLAWIGSSLSSAAFYLGRISSYPNQTLKRLIIEDLTSSDEFEQMYLNFLKLKAFGAYVMTATDFNTGFEAAIAIESQDEPPTIELAEEIIAEWRAKHQVAT